MLLKKLPIFLQVVGLIDGTHIPIKGPSKDWEDYYNRKLVTQAVVDANGKCLNVSVGCPGSLHDTRVYRYSKLFERIERGEILTQPSRRIGAYNTPPLLLGDSAYPLSQKLLKPYPENAVNGAPERRFNPSRCRTRVKVEQGFGELQGRWRCLSKRCTGLHCQPAGTRGRKRSQWASKRRISSPG